MDLCAIGARIKAARERADYTQEDLAAELDMSPTHISVLERSVKTPKLETLVRIANTLHVSTDMLLQDVATYASDGIASELSIVSQICNLLLELSPYREAGLCAGVRLCYRSGLHRP